MSSHTDDRNRIRRRELGLSGALDQSTQDTERTEIMDSTREHDHRIAHALQAGADHLTNTERQALRDGALPGCLVQDGLTALALVYDLAADVSRPEDYSPERWEIESWADARGCAFVLWEVDGRLLDGFPDMSGAEAVA